MAVLATNKAIRISPRKVSEVAALVRGRAVSDALIILDHTPRRSAAVVRKLLLSAQANAEHNHNYRPGTLFVSEIMVSAGARYQRFRPAARGRALRYARKTSYIRVKVDGEQRPIKKKAAVTAKETKK